MNASSYRAATAWTLRRSYGFGAARIRLAPERGLYRADATRAETLRALPTLLRETRGRGLLAAALVLTSLGALVLVIVRPTPDSLTRAPLELSWWTPSLEKPRPRERAVRPRPTPARVERVRPEPERVAVKPPAPPPKPVIDAVRALPGAVAVPAAPAFRAPSLAARRSLPVPGRGGIAIESPRRALTPNGPEGVAARDVAAVHAPSLPSVSSSATTSATTLPAIAPIAAPIEGGEKGRAARRSAQQQSLIAGVPLSALAGCPDPREEDRLKLRVLASVGDRDRCGSRAGNYHFVQTNNLNAFLMSIERSADRAAENRCGELRRALACLASIGPAEGAS